jgi:hypothetical protein
MQGEKAPRPEPVLLFFTECSEIFQYSSSAYYKATTGLHCLRGFRWVTRRKLHLRSSELLRCGLIKVVDEAFTFTFAYCPSRYHQ